MKTKRKILLMLLLTAAMLIVCAACSFDSSPYKSFTKNGYGVSVHFDSNGGNFAGYSGAELVDVLPTANAINGNIKLLAPGDPQRGEGRVRSQISRTNYFLAGWYRERDLRVDANGNALDENGRRATLDAAGNPLYKDASGNPIDENGVRLKVDENGAFDKQYTRQGYIYGGKWDFETDTLTVEPNKKYSGQAPVLTLYAAWIPYFTYDFYMEDANGTWQRYNNYAFNPDPTLTGGESKWQLAVPAWDEKTGGMQYGNFPYPQNKTFEAVYADSDCMQAITQTLAHSGRIDYEHGIAVDSVNDFYTEWRDGEWFRISKVEQFANASIKGCYEILADLNFTDVNWPSGLARGEFTGKIIGNGHTFSNITVEQVDMNDQTFGGLFGRIADGAEITETHFENVTYRLLAGSRKQGTGFGLFAGNIAENAKITDVTIENGVLEIGEVYALYAANSDRTNGYDGYNIGLISGNSVNKGISVNSVVCRAANVADEGEEARYPVKVTVDASTGAVTVAVNDTPAVNPN